MNHLTPTAPTSVDWGIALFTAGRDHVRGRVPRIRTSAAMITQRAFRSSTPHENRTPDDGRGGPDACCHRSLR